MKELVEHIRTVHFTVFVVALVLTIAERGHKKPQLERAASDAEAILLLEQKWPAVTQALSTAVDNAAKGLTITSVSGSGRMLEADDPGTYIVRGHAISPNRPLLFDVPRRWIYVDEAESDENPGWGESQEFIERLPAAWRDLKEFFQFWDGFHDGRRAFVTIGLASAAGAKYCGNVEKVGGNPPLTAFLVLHASFTDHWQLSFTLEAMDRDPNVHKLACQFAPVTVSRWGGDLGAVFAGVAAQAAKWGNGMSIDEFKDLDGETKYLEELPIDKLAGALRERANADTDSVELFQAKLPLDAIATYGALLLITCQLYLLAHLIELRRVARKTDRADWPTGYVGLYENLFISVFTFISLAVWPPFPLLLLLRRPAIDKLSFFYGWSVFILSLVIALSSASILALLRKQTRRTAELSTSPC